MDELVRWLGEQFDRDERISRAATLGPWVQSGIGEYGWTVDFGRAGAGVETADTEQGRSDADFIAAHNPARVLREIDAKRRMIGRIDSHATIMGWDEVHGDLLHLLALPYADRPGYRAEWKP
ncbi:DUF6221 family protein [Streptomyces sp. NPDC060000]|uniref:DUF6221 family protein n=1 Tax=Streptomyces sp. NPDC060000 TaxID=3347031 RepID=UPI0036AB88BD